MLGLHLIMSACVHYSKMRSINRVEMLPKLEIQEIQGALRPCHFDKLSAGRIKQKL